MIGVTMSSLPRVMACAASAVLPATRETRETPWATRGSVLHAYLRDVSTMSREDALARVPYEHLEACEALELDTLPLDPEAYAAEVALAYDWRTGRGREINRGTDSREYGASETEVAGRTDVVGLTESDVVKILDYKSGYRYLGRPDESWQLIGYALAARAAYGRREAEVSFIRLPENGTPYVMTQRLGFLDLELAAKRLHEQGELIARLRGEGAAHSPEALEPHLKAGSWCEYCPAIGRCPEKAGLLRALVSASGVDAPVFDESTVALGYQRLVHARKVLELAEKALKDYVGGVEDAKLVPVIDAPGLVWGPRVMDREELDPVRGAAVLGQRYGPDVATRAVDTRPKMTKASVKRALEPVARRNRLKITALHLEALDALRAGGATTPRTRTEWREFRADEPTSDGGDE